MVLGETRFLEVRKNLFSILIAISFVFQVDVHSSFMNISAVDQNATVFDAFSKEF